MATYQNKKNKRRLSPAQKIIISVIVILFVLLSSTILFAFLNKPENVIKSKISTLATDYYENYLYEKISNHNESNSASRALEGSEKYGLATTPLSQLLFYDKKIDQETIKYLTSHCDENKTTVKFYPEPPYSKTSYHIEFFYTCDF